MINNSGTIVLVNRTTEEIFGYARGELLNKPIETLVPENFKIPHPAFVRSYINNPEPRAMGMGRELFGRHITGKLIPVEIGLQPIHFDDEIFVISSIVDITQRKEAEKEIQDKSEEIKEFSYRTSHDLKSPLLTIVSLADCITEDIQSNHLEDACENTNKIKSLSTKLNKLVDDILILTKTDLNSEQENIFDFEGYIEDCKEKFNHILGESHVEVISALHHSKPLKVQTTRLMQVLDNLVSNAIKYSKPNSTDSFVKVSSFSDQTKFYIRVEDNGLGIPKERHKDVFSMFKRFHEGNIDGSGLGLYMLKSIFKN